MALTKAQWSAGSQMMDNLNVSIHTGAFLADTFPRGCGNYTISRSTTDLMAKTAGFPDSQPYGFPQWASPPT